MNKPPHAARYFALLIAVPLAIALSGCSVVDEVAHKMKSVSFATAAEVSDEWKGDAAWLPSDATDIMIRESTVNDTAVILATSAAALDPELCSVVPRRSQPVYELDGAPSAYDATEAYACGQWTVMAAEDGWFGWTPNHPDEATQSPTP
ncbi:hypothetical protein [Microbacterium terregens]|uniref:Lipoprotein n=1 Tax=Microbacterium terregens TaxID=69363 RepID=A0ABV5T381_9MICO